MSIGGYAPDFGGWGSDPQEFADQFHEVLQATR